MKVNVLVSTLLLAPALVFGQTILEGEITENITLTNDNEYLLRGGVFIGDDQNETILTIEPGTIIYGEGATNAMLVIRRGSKIIADGRRDAPIVFTSDQAEGEQDRADWGGLIINGRSTLNQAGGEGEGEGGTGRYGGGNNPDPHDNSGILRYVRVEYAGREISPDNELNGIAFQAVGDGTIVDYIQVHMNKDDGVEFFGGTVNVKHVYLTGEADDCLDWTDGWTGKAQFIVAQQYGDEANNGFECDNNAENNDATPYSNPKIYNFTFIGDKGDSTHRSDIGMLIRQGTKGIWKNGIVMNFGDCGIDIDHAATFNNAWDAQNNRLNGSLVVDNCIVYDNREVAQSGETGANDEAGYPFTSDRFIRQLNSNNRFVDPMLTDAYTHDMPDYRPEENSPALQNVAQVPDDGFFEDVDFIGAVGPDNDWLLGWTTPGTYRDAEVVVLEGEITSDITLTNDKVYLLRGGVFIGDDNAETVLTIEPGTYIYGEGATDAMLVIRRGSKIIADGRSDAPIVFTSDQPFGEQNRADWGGLIINGRAPLNQEGGEGEGEGGTGRYGGGNNPNPHDNSGILRYVRVEYAGREISPDNELNGIAFQAVGDGTIVDYIQVHMNKDDGVEFFGGTVNVKHVYLTGEGDDCLDWTDGWTGKAQFIVAQQYGDEANNGFECDNNAENNDAQPRSNPTIYNFTFIGDKGDSTHHSDIGMLIRQGTMGTWKNGIVMNFGDCGIDIDHAATFNNAWDAQNNRLNGSLVVDNCIIYDNREVAQTGETGANDENAYPFTSGRFIQELNTHNRFINPMLLMPYEHVLPDYREGENSPIAEGFANAPNDGWFTRANFVGGVSAAMDWLDGWTTPGTYHPLKIEETIEIVLPDAHRLVSAYPNPFNSTTRINYLVATAGKARLNVFALDGRQIATLVDGYQTPGSHSATWDAKGIAAGTYIVRLESAGYSSSRLISLLK
jgi:hypothetical protein